MNALNPQQHIRRANYQTRIWKLANIAIYDLPKAWYGHGWCENGEPYWCHEDDILPPVLADVLDAEREDMEQEVDTDEDIDLLLNELGNDINEDDEEEDDEDDE